jgi:hypothetical protein
MFCYPWFLGDRMDAGPADWDQPSQVEPVDNFGAKPQGNSDRAKPNKNVVSAHVMSGRE